MAASSPSLLITSEEDQLKDHLYQIREKPGPRGAFEARQAMGGFYVRVDMPGVPQDGVKLVKRAEARTVTFTGKAPKHHYFESGDRVYAGYVVLDKNPDEVDVEMTVVHGSLRLFFPDCDGALNSLRSRTKNNTTTDDDLFKEYPDYAGYFSGRDGKPVFPTQKHSHINPFLLDGVEGVYENVNVDDANGDRRFLRVDYPGLGDQTYFVITGNARLVHGGKGKKDYPLDEGGREYWGGLMWMCECFKVCDLEHEMKDGVLRILFRQMSTPKHRPHPGKPCGIGFLQPGPETGKEAFP